MKHLVIATDSFLPRWDGVARFLSDIIPDLRKHFKVTVIAPRFAAPVPVIHGIDIVTIPTYRWNISDYKLPKFDPKTIEEVIKDSDIVWTHTIGPIGGTAIRIAHRLNKKVVAYMHSLEWELIPKSLPPMFVLRYSSAFIMRRLAQSLYNRTDMVMVPSSEVADLLQKEGIKAGKVIVPLGVCVKRFAPPKSKALAKQKIGLDKGVFVVGFCGRIAREKGLPTLFEAFSLLQKNHPNTKLLIVGGGLRQFRERYSSKDIFFTGSTDNVTPFLQAMDVYVLPSLTETSSISTMEAMAVGLPVIVTPVGNIKEYVIEGHNGFWFPKKDAKALSERIEHLMQDRKMRLEMGRHARETMLKNHIWDNTSRLIQKVLLDL